MPEALNLIWGLLVAKKQAEEDQFVKIVLVSRLVVRSGLDLKEVNVLKDSLHSVYAVLAKLENVRYSVPFHNLGADFIYCFI